MISTAVLVTSVPAYANPLPLPYTLEHLRILRLLSVDDRHDKPKKGNNINHLSGKSPTRLACSSGPGIFEEPDRLAAAEADQLRIGAPQWCTVICKYAAA